MSITPQSAVLGRGGGVMRRNASRNGSTPKFVSAEPKNTGLSVPARTSSMSNSRPAPSSSTSSRSWAARRAHEHLVDQPGIERDLHFFRALLARDAREEQNLALLAVIDALKLLAAADRPVDGVGLDAQLLFQLVEQIERILASRSSLLMKVKIGMWRMAQTLKSLRVCGSTPFAPSMTMTAESAAISVR